MAKWFHSQLLVIGQALQQLAVSYNRLGPWPDANEPGRAGPPKPSGEPALPVKSGLAYAQAR